MSKALFRTPDGQSALFFTLLGVLTVVLGLQHPIGTPAQMGPGFFPVALGALLTVVGIVVAIGALRADSECEMAAVDWRALGAITGAILLTAALLMTAGLLVAIPVLVVVGSLASRDLRPVRVLVTAAVLTAMAWAIFDWGLGLRIPAWWG